MCNRKFRGIPYYTKGTNVPMMRILLCGSSLPDKFIQCPESVAHLLPLRQQLIEDRRVCGGSTVQKHDGTRMDAPNSSSVTSYPISMR